MDRLFEKIQFVKGVGPARNKQLNRLGIYNIFDLLWFVPRGYFNQANTTLISQIGSGNCNLRGKVLSANVNHTRRFTIFKALISDGSGTITAVWFNQPYLATIIKPGQDIFIAGKVKSDYGTAQVSVSYYEILDESSDLGVMPIYALTAGISQKVLRRLVSYVLENYLRYYPDVLDLRLKQQYGLCDIAYAFNHIHYPSDREAYLQARKRLAFEELYLFQLSLAKERRPDYDEGFVVHQVQTNLVEQVIEQLPFELTQGQKRAVEEIQADMEKPARMNRLLQGDVGAGKTVVAVLAIARALASGYQAALMAPTEILADQHYTGLKKFFDHTGVVIARLTGSTTAGVRSSLLEAVRGGEADILVGTHALFQEQVEFARLGLVVIDEQHRFGVRQRAMLGNKGTYPDVLVMTATPIPRTLALTIYGDLDLSIIRELPPGRKPVKTINIKKNMRRRAYELLRKEVNQGHQAYVVCPLVEESESQDLQAATALYEQLGRIMPELSFGLLHGRLKPADKEAVMQQFEDGYINVLIATTVVEVGVDVPGATVMLIEEAERFGLSQLHQLRGRVGRGKEQAYCILIGNPNTEEGIKRLQAMEKTNDGFEIARLDLLIRGPGEFWGVRQHGLNQLKVADLTRDQGMVEITRNLAKDRNGCEEDPVWDLYIQNKFKKTDDIASN
ncbi:MAG TPA: DNA helicase RecG [Syntrophomonas sp.]|jgi:ATP-dependent DNA helicase RecG|nr:DNA helicase RecG [Syntrophomonas sp.]